MESRSRNTTSTGVHKTKTPDKGLSSNGIKQPKHSTPVKSSSKKTSAERRTEQSTPPSQRMKTSVLQTKQEIIDNELSSSRLSSASHSPLHSSLRKPLVINESRIKGQADHTLTSPDYLPSSPLTQGMQARVTEFENNTIAKQRGEIQMLVSELRDRDRELNEMVLAHQREMAAWDQDRQKIASLENKCSQLERHLQERNQRYHAVVAKLRTLESEELNKSTALNHTQSQLAEITEQHTLTTSHLNDTKNANRSLSTTVRDLSTCVGQLEAREEELLTVLKIKERELSEYAAQSEELKAKLLANDSLCQSSRENETALKRDLAESQNITRETKRELELFRRDFQKLEAMADQRQVEIQKLKQDLSTSRKEVALSNEREKRKDQLLELQKSKQERTDTELTNLRQLYEHQQRDLSLLHLNLQTTKDLLNKQNTRRSPEYSSHIQGSYSTSPSRSRERSPTRLSESGGKLEQHKYSAYMTTSGESLTQAADTERYDGSAYTGIDTTARSQGYNAERSRSSSYDGARSRSPGYQRARSPTYDSRSRSPGYDGARSRSPTYVSSRSKSPAYDSARARSPAYETTYDSVRSRSSAYDSGRARSTDPYYNIARTSLYDRRPVSVMTDYGHYTNPGSSYSYERSMSPIDYATISPSSKSRPRGYALNRASSPAAILARSEIQPKSEGESQRVGGYNGGTGSSLGTRPVQYNTTRDDSYGALGIKTNKDDEVASQRSNPEVTASPRLVNSHNNSDDGSNRASELDSGTKLVGHDGLESQGDSGGYAAAGMTTKDEEGAGGEVADVLSGGETGNHQGTPREHTPVNIPPHMAGLSVDQVNSPATQLHHLLTESRDMAQELENSANNSQSSHASTHEQNNTNMSSRPHSQQEENGSQEPREESREDQE